MEQIRPKKSIRNTVLVFAAIAFLFFLIVVIRQLRNAQTNRVVLAMETGEPTITTTTKFTETIEPTKIPEITPSLIPTVERTPTNGVVMVLAQTVNGIEITAYNIRRGDGLLKADICFPVLDNEDWTLSREVFLRFDGNDIKMDGFGIIDPLIPAVDSRPGRRCDTVYFEVSDRRELSEFSIIVPSIWALPREGLLCKRLDEVKETLTESGIQVRCQEEEWTGGYQIISKPSTMSEEEAQTLLSDVINFTIKGPWEFTVRLK